MDSVLLSDAVTVTETRQCVVKLLLLWQKMEVVLLLYWLYKKPNLVCLNWLTQKTKPKREREGGGGLLRASEPNYEAESYKK